MDRLIMMYEHIKENFINRFLNPRYRWATVISKNSIICNIGENCPFPVKSIENGNKILIDLGDNIIIDINLVWEDKIIANDKNIVHYRLISFE